MSRERSYVTKQFLEIAEIEYVLCAVKDEPIAWKDLSGVIMSKEHDEDAEYYHDMDGDVF